MNSREVSKLLFDVRQACERILKFVEGRKLPILLREVRAIKGES